MTSRSPFRQATAALLMVAGSAILLRGFYYSAQHGLGIPGLLQSGIIGALVFALGLARWRFLRKG